MTTHANTIRFTKMHGLGNDFVIIDAIHQTLPQKQLPITQLADRHVGIGFDQLLLIEPSQEADFFCRIFNADGSEAEQCGNGLRCLARLLHEEKIHPASSLRLETKAGIFPIFIKDYDHIRVTLDAPRMEETLLELSVNNPPTLLPVSILSLGNPHAITNIASVNIEAIDKVPVTAWGSEISSSAFFRHGANVGFMQIVNPHHIRLRTFERGVGETHACGSNACAAVCAGIANGWLKHAVKVELRYGCLQIEWEGGNGPVHLTGPASRSFTGKIII